MKCNLGNFAPEYVTLLPGYASLVADPDWQAGNAHIGGIAAIRSPAETEKYVKEQFELCDKLVTALGIRQ